MKRSKLVLLVATTLMAVSIIPFAFNGSRYDDGYEAPESTPVVEETQKITDLNPQQEAAATEPAADTPRAEKNDSSHSEDTNSAADVQMRSNASQNTESQKKAAQSAAPSAPSAQPEASAPSISKPSTSAPALPETPPSDSIPTTPSLQKPVNPPVNTEPDTPQVDSTPETPTEDSSISSFAQQVVKLVNQERVKAGLNTLTISQPAKTAAQVRAKEIEKTFSHTRPDGSSFGSALAEQGVTIRNAGENIAIGQKSPEEVMKGWMNSSGHRANILNPNYTSIGVGCYQNASGTYYWTQLFIG